jgi:cytochrome c
VRDESAVRAVIKKGVKADPPGLALLRTNNCFNCHSFDSKGIGPSFYDVGKRYPFTAANIAQVAKRVREGSTGVWGKVSMPTHPELQQKEAEDVVRWVLKHGAERDVNYYVGMDGIIKVKGKGAYILTASYMDHGKQEGQDVRVIRR